MKTITIITDSLAMPRVEGDEKIFIQQTWPKLLAQKLGNEYVFAEFKERARDTDSLRIEQLFFETITCCKPEILMLEIGIVDCAPRIISKQENAMMNRRYFPKPLRQYIIKKRKRQRTKILAKGPLNKVYVSPENYRKNLMHFLQKVKEVSPSTTIILLPIVGNFQQLEQKSKGYTANKDLYNNILQEVAQTTRLFYAGDLLNTIQQEDFYTLDGYHLTAKGHSQVTDFLVETFKRQHL